MKNLLALALLALAICASGQAFAQQPVYLVQKVCNTDSGVQVCNYVPIDSSFPLVISNTPVTVTSTPVTLTAATSAQLLAPATDYKYVCMMNIGTTNPFTFVPGPSTVAAVVGQGQAINPASGAGNQGGGYCFPSPPKNGIQGISTGGTTVIVEYGK